MHYTDIICCASMHYTDLYHTMLSAENCFLDALLLTLNPLNIANLFGTISICHFIQSCQIRSSVHCESSYIPVLVPPFLSLLHHTASCVVRCLQVEVDTKGGGPNNKRTHNQGAGRQTDRQFYRHHNNVKPLASSTSPPFIKSKWFQIQLIKICWRISRFFCLQDYLGVVAAFP